MWSVSMETGSRGWPTHAWLWPTSSTRPAACSGRPHWACAREAWPAVLWSLSIKAKALLQVGNTHLQILFTHILCSKCVSDAVCVFCSLCVCVCAGDCLFVLKGCPSLALLQALTQEYQGQPAVLSLGFACHALLNSDLEDLALQMVEKTHSSGQGS